MARFYARLIPLGVVGGLLAAVSLGSSTASALDQKCESAPAAAYPVSQAEVSATEGCFNAIDESQSTELNALSALAQSCPNAPASAMQGAGGGFQKSSTSGLKDAQATAKAKVRYFTGEKALYAKHGQTVVAARLGNIVSRLGVENTAVIAVWTDFANVATALSGDDCDSVATAADKAMTDWGNENSTNSDLAGALGQLVGRHTS
jgi:hypothetical protein